MTLATVMSRAQSGLDAPQVTVEVDVGGGLPALTIVGLPEAVVRESKDRVRSALNNSGYEYPDGRITVSLAPADLPKDGGRFDLPIAVGILLASRQLLAEAVDEYELCGELSLSGQLKPFPGALPTALCVRRAKRSFVLPSANAREAALVKNLKVLPAEHLLEVCAHLAGQQLIAPQPLVDRVPLDVDRLDLADVRGQPLARRALEIVAAGGHSLLMIGPPGSGKTMLAERLPGILPPLGEEAALEVASVRSIRGYGFDLRQWRRRPFRAPHHSASAVALVGGGSVPRPGEISLAHEGVLFLDELPEFDRRVLEMLREPLQSGRIFISRAARQAEFPARFQLVAAMNPCPCGHLGDSNGRCRCSLEQITRYRARISGPLLDRIDVHIEVPPVEIEALSKADGRSETSAGVGQRVAAARQRQTQRQGTVNAELSGSRLEAIARLTPSARDLLQRAISQLGLSARAYHRVIQVARTIADLAEEDVVDTGHIGEAVNLRRLDRRLAMG